MTINPANFNFCMFDAVAKHIRENKPSNWEVVDEICIDYHDKHLKLSILSSQDALHVLIMLDVNQTERFHLDTWDDVYDLLVSPNPVPHHAPLRDLFRDILLARGVNYANS